MKILGIDPGTARMGWGIIDTEPKLMMVGSGIFSTVHEDAEDQKIPLAERLAVLHNYLTNKIRTERPHVIAVERLFFNFNVQTAMSVGEGRGVVMLAAAQNKVPVVEYTALTAKLILAGHGRAEKKQLTTAVKKILKIKELPSSLDDAADALAMALTHHYKLTNQAAPRLDSKFAGSDRKGRGYKPKISAAMKSRAKSLKAKADKRKKKGKI